VKCREAQGTNDSEDCHRFPLRGLIDILQALDGKAKRIAEISVPA